MIAGGTTGRAMHRAGSRVSMRGPVAPAGRRRPSRSRPSVVKEHPTKSPRLARGTGGAISIAPYIGRAALRVRPDSSASCTLLRHVPAFEPNRPETPTPEFRIAAPTVSRWRIRLPAPVPCAGRIACRRRDGDRWPGGRMCDHERHVNGHLLDGRARGSRKHESRRRWRERAADRSNESITHRDATPRGRHFTHCGPSCQ